MLRNNVTPIFTPEMKRRAVLGRLAAMGGLAVVSYAGFRWLRLNTSPNFEELSQHKKLIAALADVIIPRTDSPAASESGVEEFIIKMIIECSDTKTQNNFIEGLEEVEDYCSQKFNTSFIDCSLDQKNQAITFFSNKEKSQNEIVAKVQKKLLGNTFFATLKEYTVIGYFTSKAGATESLRYSLVPSKYIACQPYAIGEKAWATF